VTHGFANLVEAKLQSVNPNGAVSCGGTNAANLDAETPAWYRPACSRDRKACPKGDRFAKTISAVSENQQLNKAGYYERFF
jgi:hypothetical protein